MPSMPNTLIKPKHICRRKVLEVFTFSALSSFILKTDNVRCATLYFAHAALKTTRIPTCCKRGGRHMHDTPALARTDSR